MASDGDNRAIGAGHNLDAGSLLSVIRRLESLDREKRELNEDIKTIKAEAKGNGFDIGVINFILRERKQSRDDIEEFQREVEKYRNVLDSVEDL